MVRHPEPEERPTFTSLVQYLSQAKELLLQHCITTEEINESPNATVIGGPLEAGHGLFKDLQIKYLE